MPEELQLIGVTKITVGTKITLIKDVANLLDAKEGDKIAFYKDKKGNIVLKKV
jgi:Cu/Ag efflux protein CusF